MGANTAFPPAHYAVYSNPLPGRERDLDAWYENVHIPDSLDAGLFDSVRRYRRADDPEVTSAEFLTLWGCQYEDTEAALARVRPVAEGLRAGGRIEVVQEVVFQEFVFAQQIFRDRSEALAPCPRLTTYHSCWADPTRLAPFEAWLASDSKLDLRSDGAESSGCAARYGVRGARARAIVLVEHDQETPPSEGTECEGSALCHGLPPFGDPVPIFPSGSPAPSPPPVHAPAKQEQTCSAWVADWELVSVRHR